MKISIITVSYNSAATIEDTIKSVIGQNYTDWEYIIVDGGSTDGTLDIIKKYQSKITKVISEPDQGIYDAMNKGVGAVTGEVVGIINSDDFYCDNGILKKVAEVLSSSMVDAVYGDLLYVDRLNVKKVVRRWEAGEYNQRKLYSGWIFPHPTFFVRRSWYDRYGWFDLSFKIAADYELMLRFLAHGLRPAYIHDSLVCMREGGHSAKSFSQRQKGWAELRRSWIKNGRSVPMFFIARRIISKLKQYYVAS